MPDPSPPAGRPRPPLRAFLLLPAGLGLLAGLDAALLLLGLPAPVSADRLAQLHGMLLVLGFVGTVIALERAVALGRRAGYVAPAATGLGALLLVAGAPISVCRSLFILGTGALLALYVPLWRRQRADAVLVQAAGALLALGAALLWAGGAGIPVLLPWLVGFLVLTIVGERIELAAVAFLGPRAVPVIVALSATVVVAAPTALLWPAPGYPLLGAALLGIVGWLAVHDVARRTVRSSGLARYVAVCLLTGYVWLAVAGAAWLLLGPLPDGAGYDLVVHAVFLGFVITMVMAHAPVILPAVVRRPLPYHPLMYLPVVLLTISLVLRTVGGDLREVVWAWQWGGLLNIVSVLLFVAVAAWSALRRPAASPRRSDVPSEPALTGTST